MICVLATRLLFTLGEPHHVFISNAANLPSLLMLLGSLWVSKTAFCYNCATDTFYSAS